MKKVLLVTCLLALSACCMPKGEKGDQGAVGIPGGEGPQGDQGIQGIAGLNGTNGTNGTNGSNGTNGANAPINPYDIAGLINPCGDAPGIYDEVFIKLNNGTVIASFSANNAGDLTRFVVVPAGSYITTDGDNCVFTINSSGIITYQNHTF